MSFPHLVLILIPEIRNPDHLGLDLEIKERHIAVRKTWQPEVNPEKVGDIVSTVNESTFQRNVLNFRI